MQIITAALSSIVQRTSMSFPTVGVPHTASYILSPTFPYCSLSLGNKWQLNVQSLILSTLISYEPVRSFQMAKEKKLSKADNSSGPWLQAHRKRRQSDEHIMDVLWNNSSNFSSRAYDLLSNRLWGRFTVAEKDTFLWSKPHFWAESSWSSLW